MVINARTRVIYMVINARAQHLCTFFFILLKVPLTHILQERYVQCAYDYITTHIFSLHKADYITQKQRATYELSSVWPLICILYLWLIGVLLQYRLCTFRKGALLL